MNRVAQRPIWRALAFAALSMSSLAACSDGSTAPTTTSPATIRTPVATASASASSANVSFSLIKLIEIERGSLAPNTIDPCWLVNIGIYNAARRVDGYTAEFTFVYVSGGRTVTKHFVTNLTDAIAEAPLPGQASNLIRLTNGLDVGVEPPEPESPIRGLVQLVFTAGRTRIVLAQSALTETPRS
ncbi:MAG: hypothetical protein ABJE10_14790 [bacterium]